MVEFPEINEVVVCKIVKVMDYGVTVELLEYEGIQGFVHISQVASSWVKNIRNFVKENQVRAAQVTHFDTHKNQLDLSFNKVSSGTQRTKIEEWKQLKRCKKLIELLAKQKGLKFEQAWEEIAVPLLKEHDSLYAAFREVLKLGDQALTGVDKKWVPDLIEIISKNIEIQKKTVKGVLTLYSFDSNGLNVLKNTLVKARDSAKGVEPEIYSIGSGRYGVNVTSVDFKLAEKELKNIADKAIELIQQAKGFGSFEKAG